MSGSRRKPGPLGPFVDGYRARLLELGYSPLSVRHSLTALGHLGRWMDREELEVEQLNDDVLEAFLADHVAEHGHLPSAGVMPLLEYLRGEGVVPPEPARRLTLIDRFLDEYRDWLAVETQFVLVGTSPLRVRRRTHEYVQGAVQRPHIPSEPVR